MQLAITALGELSSDYLAELLSSVRDSKCSIVELRSSCLAQTRATYLLVQGSWNQIAKLENALESLHKHFAVQIHNVRTEPQLAAEASIPYVLETFSVDKDAVIESLSNFLVDRDINIEEVTGSSYQAAYNQTAVFAIRFVLLIPAHSQLMTLREDILDYCDQLNLDALFEPIKR